MRRTQSGFSLLELLAVTAVVGLLAVVGVQVTTQVEKEAKAADASDAAFERRELGLMRLRAAAARATSARVDRGRVLLRSADGETAWCVVGEEVVSGAPTHCEPDALLVESRGRLLRVRLGGREELVLVGTP